VKRIIVYAAQSIDHVGNEQRPGGPLFYAYQALRAIGAWETYVEGINRSGGCYAVFEHQERDGKRSSRMLRKPRCTSIDLNQVGGDAALISPIDLEIPLEHLDRIMSQYKFNVVDLQGFFRIVLSNGRIMQENSYASELVGRIFTSAVTRPENHVFKVSLEDLGYDRLVSYTLLRMAQRKGVQFVVTLSEEGVIAATASGSLVRCTPNIVVHEKTTIGAGDILSTLMLYGLLRGFKFTDSIGRAVATTSCILSKRSHDGLEIAESVCRDVYTNGNDAYCKEVYGIESVAITM
jgi:hypothetical protein